MESTNLITRTYTAPTCSLIVTTKAPLLPNLTQLKKPQAVDFTLHLGHPEQAESERIVLKGDPQQLGELQQSVSKYVADLVAKFPLPTTDNNSPASSQPAGTPVVEGQVTDRQRPHPGERANGSGLIQNLPGLRTGSPQSTPATKTDSPVSPLSTKNISKLLGLGKAANNAQEIAPTANPTKIAPQTPSTPYLTGGDRSLDHKLHLGNLATSSSGEVLTLSAIQLFDLATTLDECVAEASTQKSIETTTISPTSLKPVEPKTETYQKGIGASNPASPQAPVPAAPINPSISRLSNLPPVSAPSTTSQVYDYANNGGSRAAFLSVIPWAAAAALAVGVPLLLFGSKSNSLKELTSHVKLPANVKLPAFKTPDFEAAKQSVMSRLPGQEPATSTDPATTTVTTTTATTATTNPKPWEQQPIQPPQTPTGAKIPGAQMPTTPDKIGIAPLPPTMMDSAGQAVPARVSSGNVATKPAPTKDPGVKVAAKPVVTGAIPTTTTGLTEIAPNPLSSPSLPPQLSSPPIASQPTQPKPISMPTTATKPTQPKISNPVTTLPVAPAKIAAAPKIVKPKVTSIQPSKVSIAKKPMAMPPDLSSAGQIKPAPVVTQIPFSPPEIQVAERVNPSTAKPTAKKKIAKAKVKAKAKPTAVAIDSKPTTVKQPIPVLTPQPVTEPFNPSPNPNLINPLPPVSNEGTNIQPNPPAFPEPQPQSNIGRNPNTADPFDSPSLKETKRYFQSKWQADPNQSNSLQYVVRVSGKSGLVQTVSPQGEPATEYLKKTKLIKPGDKLVSPGAAGRSDQKIRVVLQPDGTVDAFGEP
jgi:Domain of unknown function (DUF4335)